MHAVMQSKQFVKVSVPVKKFWKSIDI